VSDTAGNIKEAVSKMREAYAWLTKAIEAEQADKGDTEKRWRLFYKRQQLVNLANRIKEVQLDLENEG
jgi:hypothetical protein